MGQRLAGSKPSCQPEFVLRAEAEIFSAKYFPVKFVFFLAKLVNVKLRQWISIAFVLISVLIAGSVIAFRLAVRTLRDQVVTALGPGSEIEELKVGWSAVEIIGLRIQGSKGWPALDALRADRVVIEPSLRSLLSDQIEVSSISIVRPYLSLLRSREGKLRVLPSLLDGSSQKTQSKAEAPSRTVAISRIRLEDGVMELFDATVARPPLKIRLEDIQASVRDIVAPALNGKIQFDLKAMVKGVSRDGRADIAGWTEGANKDSSVKMSLRSVDMVLLQPYFVKAGETQVRKGALDLDLQSEVRKRRLRAPGKAIMSNLEFGPSRGAVDTVMGMPRAMVVNFLKNNDGKIEVKFTIEGDIDNPKFSLNETFATRVASAMAEGMGVSIRGVAEGVEG
ncbi:MAG: DUF748 domain-containing protein, partial [Candidatus Binatia bacterium]